MEGRGESCSYRHVFLSAFEEQRSAGEEKRRDWQPCRQPPGSDPAPPAHSRALTLPQPCPAPRHLAAHQAEGVGEKPPVLPAQGTCCQARAHPWAPNSQPGGAGGTGARAKPGTLRVLPLAGLLLGSTEPHPGRGQLVLCPQAVLTWDGTASHRCDRSTNPPAAQPGHPFPSASPAQLKPHPIPVPGLASRVGCGQPGSLGAGGTFRHSHPAAAD